MRYNIKPQAANHKTFLVKMLPKNSIGVEIGVWTGKFTRQVLRIVDPKQYHLVDPWAFMPKYPKRWYGGSRAQSQLDMDKIFKEINQEFGPIPCIVIHRATAAEAAKQFQPHTFDWAYIDGDHSYDEVKKDINTYYPLVRPGGILCGDDWQLDSVRKAVREILGPSHTINNHTYQWWITK